MLLGKLILNFTKWGFKLWLEILPLSLSEKLFVKNYLLILWMVVPAEEHNMVRIEQ